MRECSDETFDSRTPRRGCSAARRIAAVALAVGALAGCQSYEPRPLDLAMHRDAFRARTLAGDSLADFLERLDAAALAPPRTRDAFDATDGLTLDEGRLVALAYHPELRLARLRLGRAAASAEHAGLWDDPELSLSVLRATESLPKPWLISTGIGFTLPISGRLGIEEDEADAALEAERRRAFETEWEVWVDVRVAWIEWSAIRLRLAEAERLVAAIEPLVETARRLADAGEIFPTEAALFAVERAERAAQLRRQRAELVVAEEVLRAQLGLAPNAPVTFEASLALEPDEDAADTPTAGERHPTLARLRAEYAVAEERLRLEIAKQVPDLTLGPSYENEEGESRIGFFGGIPLPILNANRRAIAVAEVDRAIARARFETTYELLEGRLAIQQARVRALAEQREELERELVPLVDGQLADALELARLGEGTPLVLLESLSRSQDAKLALIEARVDEALARAELERLIGPPEAANTNATEDTP